MIDTSRYRTDKIALGYLPAYEAMAAVATPGLRILEIGVGDGAGMILFRDLFYLSQVYGVDNDPERARQLGVLHAEQDDPKVATWWGDSLSPLPWDLIVDDASHRPGETSRTLANMWPQLIPGGWYVIEDWNYFDGPGMWSCLWPKIMGWWLGHPPLVEVGQASIRTPYSGQLEDIENVTVQHGMIILRKVGDDG